jgi:hypothetical protein
VLTQGVCSPHCCHLLWGIGGWDAAVPLQGVCSPDCCHGVISIEAVVGPPYGQGVLTFKLKAWAQCSSHVWDHTLCCSTLRWSFPGRQRWYAVLCFEAVSLVMVACENNVQPRL